MTQKGKHVGNIGAVVSHMLLFTSHLRGVRIKTHIAKFEFVYDTGGQTTRFKLQNIHVNQALVIMLQVLD
mgnify:CR=1 FL=1